MLVLCCVHGEQKRQRERVATVTGSDAGVVCAWPPYACEVPFAALVEEHGGVWVRSDGREEGDEVGCDDSEDEEQNEEEEEGSEGGRVRWLSWRGTVKAFGEMGFEGVDEAGSSGGGSSVSRVGHVFGCRYCDYQSSVKGSVTRHERSHSGEKPYGCRYCDYRSSEKGNVTVHERRHTGEKPFGCRYCDYRSSQKGPVTAHERRHTGEKPFGCRYCDYRSSQKSSVTAHERSHTGQPNERATQQRHRRLPLES